MICEIDFNKESSALSAALREIRESLRSLRLCESQLSLPIPYPLAARASIRIPALAIMSNRMTEAQVGKIVRWARQIGSGRVTLMFDCEPTGDEGAKEALWQLAQRRLDVRLAWSLSMHEGAYAGKQPEVLTREDVERMLASGAPS